MNKLLVTTLLSHEEPGAGQGAQLLGDIDKGINIRRLSAIPTTRRHANISARPIDRRATSGRRRSSSSRSPTAVAVLATIMNSW